jgi:hypothetical protein
MTEPAALHVSKPNSEREESRGAGGGSPGAGRYIRLRTPPAELGGRPTCGSLRRSRDVIVTVGCCLDHVHRSGCSRVGLPVLLCQRPAGEVLQSRDIVHRSSTCSVDNRPRVSSRIGTTGRGCATPKADLF